MMRWRLIPLSMGLAAAVACAPVVLPDGTTAPDHPLLRYHRVYRPGKAWRLGVDGVELRRAGVIRSPGKPLSADAIWRDYHREINRWSYAYKVPAELVIAVIATEAKRKGTTWSREPRSLRTEAGYVSDSETPALVSAGLMQVTLSTARAVMALEDVPAAQVDREWLMKPDNAIRVGVAYLGRQGRGQMCNAATLLDPPVAMAAYNTGHIARMGGRKNPWKLKQYPKRSGAYITKAVSFFNDAVAVLRGHAIPPVYSYYDYLRDLDAWAP